MVEQATCPECARTWEPNCEQHASIALFGECITCRFTPDGKGSRSGTAAELDAIQVKQREMVAAAGSHLVAGARLAEGAPAAIPPLVNAWHPMANACDLKHLGKLGEEANELGAAVSRCIIQGIRERHPVTGKRNDEWLEDEIADVLANIDLVAVRFDLDMERVALRLEAKKTQLASWHEMA